MQLFSYKATTAKGELLQGVMEGADRASVIAQIQSAGHIPIRVGHASNQPFRLFLRSENQCRHAISQRQLTLFTQELASLLQAGLPLDRALHTMIDVCIDSKIRELATIIQDAVRGGSSLSDAMEGQGGVFSRFYVSMVRAAEASGNLDQGLTRLEEYLVRSKALKDSVLSALIYPSILFAVAAISLVIILTYVVPQFTQLFSDMGRALPLSTQIVVSATRLMSDYWWILAFGVLTLVFFLRSQLSRPEGRYRWHRLQLRLPLIGDFIRKIEMARFSRSLGILLASGVPLLPGLSIAKDILINRVMSDCVAGATETLRDGRGMAEQLMIGKQFPALGLELIKVGEETGQLDEMLLRVAEIYDREVTVGIQRILALLEPVLIVGLGLVIGGIIMSILVAIVSVNDLPL